MQDTKEKRSIFDRTVLSIMVSQPLKIRVILSAADKIITSNTDMIETNQKKKVFKICQRSESRSSVTYEGGLPGTVKFSSAHEPTSSNSHENSAYQPLSLFEISQKNQKNDNRNSARRVCYKDEWCQTSTATNPLEYPQHFDASEEEEITQVFDGTANCKNFFDKSTAKIAEEHHDCNAHSKSVVQLRTHDSANSTNTTSKTVSVTSTDNTVSLRRPNTIDLHESYITRTGCESQLQSNIASDYVGSAKPSIVILDSTSVSATTSSVESTTTVPSASPKKPTITGIVNTTSHPESTVAFKKHKPRYTIPNDTTKRTKRVTTISVGTTTASNKLFDSQTRSVDETSATKRAATVSVSTKTTLEKPTDNADFTSSEDGGIVNHPNCLKWYEIIKDDSFDQLHATSSSYLDHSVYPVSEANNETEQSQLTAEYRKHDPCVELRVKNAGKSSSVGIFSWLKNKWGRNRVYDSRNKISSPLVRNYKTKKKTTVGNFKRDNEQRYIDKKTGVEYVIPVIVKERKSNIEAPWYKKSERQTSNVAIQAQILQKQQEPGKMKNNLITRTRTSPHVLQHLLLKPKRWRMNRTQIFRDHFIKRKMMTTVDSTNDSWWKNFNSNMLPE